LKNLVTVEATLRLHSIYLIPHTLRANLLHDISFLTEEIATEHLMMGLNPKTENETFFTKFNMT